MIPLHIFIIVVAFMVFAIMAVWLIRGERIFQLKGYIKRVEHERDQLLWKVEELEDKL